MRLRHVLPLALAGALLLGGSGVGNERIGDRTGSHQPESRLVAASGVKAVPSTRDPLPAKTVPTIRRALPAPARQLPADVSELVGETVALQMLADDAGLQLEPEQWTALAAVTLETQAVRQAFEATIAKAMPNETGGCRVEIPAYAAAGDALRARFEAGLREKLGPACAAEVLARIGRKLEGYFGGFGVCVQTLDFAADARDSEREWAVTRTVRYWNSVEGGESLSTRRETLLPGREDPAGMSWAPLLSLVEAAVGSGVGT